MGARRLKLRHHGTCAVCARPLAKGVDALWDPTAKSVTCLACVGPPRTSRWEVGTGRRTLVTESGVWLIDARRYMGLITAVDNGGWFRSDQRLFVGGHDRTALVESLGRRAHRLRRALDGGPAADVPVHAALCFVDADFRLVSEPLEHNGVLVTWVRDLTRRLGEPGPIDTAQRVRLHADLAKAFPSLAATTATAPGPIVVSATSRCA